MLVAERRLDVAAVLPVDHVIIEGHLTVHDEDAGPHVAELGERRYRSPVRRGADGVPAGGGFEYTAASIAPRAG